MPIDRRIALICSLLLLMAAAAFAAPSSSRKVKTEVHKPAEQQHQQKQEQLFSELQFEQLWLEFLRRMQERPPIRQVRPEQPVPVELDPQFVTDLLMTSPRHRAELLEQ
ncbi:hypothetical protein BOX15_Mlig011342g2 [Macrostomum lignano]|uniref:Uncharacterized protein n=1 Tax=Macrostomum lignano TaxID=282301 RepID=A0A267DH26_9PLAT|nr:hypothetical protein BOX15_Mlig011342g2 [Macrostomum lignano]